MKKIATASAAALLLALATLVIPALATPTGNANDVPAAARTTAPASRTTSAPAPAPVPAVKAPETPSATLEPVFEAVDAPGLRPEVLRLALEAHQRATRRGVVERPELLTVIDYSLPSTEKRLWVLDLDAREVLFHELTTHGKASGGNMATRFSNVSMSLMSNLGLMTTAETYYGKNGYSLRLDGHEPGFNDEARPRAIVIHPADYATPDFIARIGRLGRSWGCPALDPAVARDLIDTIKGGSVVFGYYPDREYMAKSAFVDGAGDAALKLAASAR